jgi:DNA-binding CsgD family transcriptional regulator
MRVDAIGMVEAAYDLGASAESWMRALVERAIRLVPGATRGAAFALDVSKPTAPELGLPVAVGVDGDFPRQLMDALQSDNGLTKYFKHKVATASEVLGRGEIAGDAVGDFVLAHGAPDSFGCVALDAEGRGVVVCTDLSSVQHISRCLRTRWELVAAHVAAAHRLRTQGAGTPDDCIAHPDGRILHAVGDAVSQRARDQLRDAVVARDRARTGAVRADPEEALGLWPGLVSGRWSLVDRFERDGRRYVVARRNQPNPAGPLTLSLRERQVLGHLVQGDSMKMTAYSLGLKPSTISSYAQSVCLKLRVRRVAQLPAVALGSDGSRESPP